MKLNGNLVLNSDTTGEIQNLYIERLSTQPTFNASQQGRMYYDTVAHVYYFNDGTTWQPFATGGSAAQTAAYLSNLLTSVGTAVTNTGTWSGSTAFFGDPILASATSITNALSLLSTAAYGHEKLSELTDVALGTLANNQFLVYNNSTSHWNNHTLVLADVTDVTATAAEVNTLHGFTGNTANLNILSGTTASASDLNSITGYAAQSVTPTEFGYLAGATPVTSSVQGQLNNKQPLNTGLTNWASLINGAGTGIVVQTAPNTFAEVTLTSTNSDLTLTNGNGVAGNPTFGFTGNTAGLAALATTGFVVRTGSGTFSTDSIITGSSTRITVTNGDGVAASPTIDLATVTQGSTGSFLKFAVDVYGRVSSNTPVVIGDLTGILGTYYLPEAGGSMTGNITMSGGSTVTGLPTPVGATDAANKAYVDGAVAGLNIHDSVDVLGDTTNAQLTGSVYAAGTADAESGLGIGATLTDSSTGSVLVVDGVTLALGDRVLVNAFSGAAATKNGIYSLTTLGVATSVKWVLTRTSDYNNSVIGEVIPGDFTFVDSGTNYAKTGWVETGIGTSSVTHDAIKIGTDQILFTQFSGAGTYTAGTGLSLTGGVFSVSYGAGIVSVPTGEVGIDLYSSSGALLLTTDGSTQNPVFGSKLALLLKAAGGLTQDTTGLYIPAAGVTNAMLANSAITLDVDSGGTGSIALGGTLSVLGTSTQGISTSIAGSIITITAADATTASKGVSQFDPSFFTVTTGNVTIKSASIGNSSLTNPSWSISGTTGGAQAIALGTTLSVVGGSAPVTTVSSAGTLTINVASATASTLGLASFNGSQFAVVSGAVSLAMTLGQGGLTNVTSTVDTAASADLLTYNGTKWTNATRATVFGTESVGTLSDVALISPVGGQTLVYSTAASKFVNRPTYYLFTGGTAATSFTVTHNLGQKYCNVTVVDSTDEVVIPQSITFTDANNLTVTFNSAITCTVVVMGVNAS